MCTAIPVAAVLVALTAGLTFLRTRNPRSPNAALLADLLAEQAGTVDRPARSGSGRHAPCPPAGPGAANALG